MACLWHIVSRDHAGQIRQYQSISNQYIADYYYAVSLIQGQGSISGTWGENLYSSVAIIVGSVILAIVFGNVAMLVSNFNANTTNYHRKMEAVYATMDKLDLPLKLRERVNEYYTHVWLEYEALDGNINKFQQELTHTLRVEIGLFKFMNLIVKIPFWEDCSPDFLTQIVLNLAVRVSVEYLERPKKFCVYLNPGTAFGEMSLLMNYKRQANVRAVTFVEMCVLDRKTFQKIIARYPEDRRRVLTKMLQNCIEKKEIPFPWENIIEAVSTKRRITGKKDISRASVIATMTASEAARILVEAIDINVPDSSIKYGFQTFDQEFVDDAALRHAHSVSAKIREALQRTNSDLTDTLHRTNSDTIEPLQRTNSGLTEPLQRSHSGLSDTYQHRNGGMKESLQRSSCGVAPFHSYSRRNSASDSGRSSSMGELTEVESGVPGIQTHNTGNTEKALEKMMQLMHTMAENISRLQQDVAKLKDREISCGGNCNNADRMGQTLLEELKKRRSHSDIVDKSLFENYINMTAYVSKRPSEKLIEKDVLTDAPVQHESQPPCGTSLLSILPSTGRGIPCRGEVAATRGTINDTRRGIIYSGRSCQLQSLYVHKTGNPSMKVTPRSDLPGLHTDIDSEEPLEIVDPYSQSQQGRHSKSGRHPTLADMLWKRSNTSVDLLRRSSASKIPQKLKTRHSLPAGIAVTNEESHDGPGETDQYHVASSYRSHEHLHGEYMLPSSRSAQQPSPDPRCMKIEE
ncbi:unnamed protein product [Phytophthora fragariaefolia]|uniref:Unnamed protein product n=1 Tax=Phytophthora fragariaefolia TaxID=1490495 RepID=A0A9W6XAN1_9STRA|nr:unnamed protein product [Phytophthora fragariaefolia]